jgi:hypothetical protein
MTRLGLAEYFMIVPSLPTRNMSCTKIQTLLLLLTTYTEIVIYIIIFTTVSVEKNMKFEEKKYAIQK